MTFDAWLYLCATQSAHWSRSMTLYIYSIRGHSEVSGRLDGWMIVGRFNIVHQIHYKDN